MIRPSLCPFQCRVNSDYTVHPRLALALFTIVLKTNLPEIDTGGQNQRSQLRLTTTVWSPFEACYNRKIISVSQIHVV